MKLPRLMTLAGLLLALASPAPAADLSIEIHEPTQGAVVSPSEPYAEVVGAASIYGGVKALDLFLVMDSSESLRKTDPRNYRTAGVVALVRSLHPKANIQIGVVDFDRKAKLLSPLTRDREAVVRALHTLDQKGETNIAAGIRTALDGFDARGRLDASRVILLFTDGKSDEREALAAMAEARNRGVAVHTLLLGDVKEGESLLRRIAEGTQASFVAVTDPSRLRDAFLNLRTTGVERVMLSVDGFPPVPTRLVGGSFTGRVPLRPGSNRIEAIATSLSGETARAAVTVHVSGPLRVAIVTPEQDAEIGDASAGVLVQGAATTWEEVRDGPPPADFDPGIREVWLRVNDTGPFPTRVVAGRFEGRVPLEDGPNRVVAMATHVDGRTAEDEVTVTVRASGCAELRVEALRGNRPAISLSDRAVEIVFDASNSMWGRMQGEPKISVAQRILSEALDDLPDDLSLSLRVYGHQYAHASRNCRDSELMVPLGRGDRGRIRTAIGSFKPRGQTPLAYSLQQIRDDFAGFRGERAVVLVTDGIESCGGDPVAAARALQAAGPTPVHVIGFGLASSADADAGALRAIARASGGRFITARSADELRDALEVTAGTSYAVRREGRVIAEGALGASEPLRIPQGDYTLRIESAPPYEIPVSLASQQATKLLLKREGHKVFHARSTESIPYVRCEAAEATPASGGMVWEEAPEAGGSAAARRR